METEKFRLVYITCKDNEEAKKIGKTLVESKLCACVNIINQMQSLYIWEGKLIEDNESILIGKTTLPNLDSIQTKIKEIHSYTNPCIISFPILEGSREYLEWIEASVKRD